MMRSKIIESLKNESRKAFLKLDPVMRILRMEALLYEVISIRARKEAVTEGEIYNRYIERNKKRRHQV